MDHIAHIYEYSLENIICTNHLIWIMDIESWTYNSLIAFSGNWVMDISVFFFIYVSVPNTILFAFVTIIFFSCL
jgi:hypothetical protein